MEEKKYKLFTTDYLLVIVSAMGTSFVNYFFFSSLALFAEKLTGAVTFAGLMSLAYSATALITRPVSGILTDRLGRTKILIIGAALCVVACMLYSFTTSLVLLILIRVLNGVGMSLNSTSAGAAVPDIVPKERLAEGIGIFGLYTTVSQAAGPFIALAIVGDGELSSFNKLFYVSAIFCAVSLISGFFVRYERKQREAGITMPEALANGAAETSAEVETSAAVVMSAAIETSAEVETSAAIETSSATAAVSAPLAAEARRNRTFLGFEAQLFWPALVMMLLFFGIASILSFLTLYGKIRGFQVENLGWFFLVSAGGLLISRLLFGRVVDRRGGDVVIIPGLIVIAVSIFAIPFAPSLPVLICIALPYGIATGAVGPSLNTAMFNRCSPKRRGSVSAAYFASVDIGITLGAPMLGWLADHSNFDWVYRASAIIVGATVLIYIFFASDKRYHNRLARRNASR